MVSKANTFKNPERFLTRQQFQSLQGRYGNLPAGDYFFENDNLYCQSQDHLGRIKKTLLAKAMHPAMFAILQNFAKDFNDMVEHIENADMENDALKEMLAKRKNVETNE